MWSDLEARGLAAYIPPQRTMLASDGAPKTEAQRQALRARERCKSAAGVWAHKRRMADAEGVISELKTRGTLARARCRGTPLFHVQLLLGCAAVNLKRLADHAGEAASGEAAGSASGAIATLAGAQARCGGPNGVIGAAAGAGACVEIPSRACTAPICTVASREVV